MNTINTMQTNPILPSPEFYPYEVPDTQLLGLIQRIEELVKKLDVLVEKIDEKLA